MDNNIVNYLYYSITVQTIHYALGDKYAQVQHSQIFEFLNILNLLYSNIMYVLLLREGGKRLKSDRCMYPRRRRTRTDSSVYQHLSDAIFLSAR